MLELDKGPSFGQLFKLFRLKSGFSSLNLLVGSMCEAGLCLSPSELSRWQSDKRIPKDRQTILTLVYVLANAGGIGFIGEANQLLEVAGHGNLSEREISHLLMQTPISIENACCRGINRERLENYQLKTKLNLPLSKKIDDYLNFVSKKYNKTKATVIRELIDENMNLEKNV